MPIFEYQCTECGAAFERLLLKQSSTPVPCKQCSSTNTTKMFSTFSTQAANSSTGMTSAAPAFQ